MSLYPDFIKNSEFLHPKDFLELLRQKDRPSFDTSWVLKNEIRPVDIYCYLGARFQAPNGIQNTLRRDTTDNLIHWEWVLRSQSRIVIIQGLNFRTEIWISGNSLGESDKEQFIRQMKGQFSAFGAEMGKIRNSLGKR